jgi:hypothetical protein
MIWQRLCMDNEVTQRIASHPVLALTTTSSYWSAISRFIRSILNVQIYHTRISYLHPSLPTPPLINHMTSNMMYWRCEWSLAVLLNDRSDIVTPVDSKAIETIRHELSQAKDDEAKLRAIGDILECFAILRRQSPLKDPSRLFLGHLGRRLESIDSDYILRLPPHHVFLVGNYNRT